MALGGISRSSHPVTKLVEDGMDPKCFWSSLVLEEVELFEAPPG